MDIFKRKKKKQEKDVVKRNHDDIAKALEILFATKYIDKKKLYFYNFLRGMAFSAGGVIGATLIIGLLIWVLSVFDNIPVVGPLFEGTRKSIQQGSN
ncbi:MAG: DUF5665 domain-containing protein [Candidatus Saccharimonadales bacterium]